MGERKEGRQEGGFLVASWACLGLECLSVGKSMAFVCRKEGVSFRL